MPKSSEIAIHPAVGFSSTKSDRPVALRSPAPPPLHRRRSKRGNRRRAAKAFRHPHARHDCRHRGAACRSVLVSAAPLRQSQPCCKLQTVGHTIKRCHGAPHVTREPPPHDVQQRVWAEALEHDPSRRSTHSRRHTVRGYPQTRRPSRARAPPASHGGRRSSHPWMEMYFSFAFTAGSLGERANDRSRRVWHLDKP
jgi:hypothetical protein